MLTLTFLRPTSPLCLRPLKCQCSTSLIVPPLRPDNSHLSSDTAIAWLLLRQACSQGTGDPISKATFIQQAGGLKDSHAMRSLSRPGDCENFQAMSKTRPAIFYIASGCLQNQRELHYPAGPSDPPNDQAPEQGDASTTAQWAHLRA